MARSRVGGWASRSRSRPPVACQRRGSAGRVGSQRSVPDLGHRCVRSRTQDRGQTGQGRGGRARSHAQDELRRRGFPIVWTSSGRGGVCCALPPRGRSPGRFRAPRRVPHHRLDSRWGRSRSEWTVAAGRARRGRSQTRDPDPDPVRLPGAATNVAVPRPVPSPRGCAGQTPPVPREQLSPDVTAGGILAVEHTECSTWYLTVKHPVSAR
jgi:hypothetical protein